MVIIVCIFCLFVWKTLITLWLFSLPSPPRRLLLPRESESPRDNAQVEGVCGSSSKARPWRVAPAGGTRSSPPRSTVSSPAQVAPPRPSSSAGFLFPPPSPFVLRFCCSPWSCISSSTWFDWALESGGCCRLMPSTRGFSGFFEVSRLHTRISPFQLYEPIRCAVRDYLGCFCSRVAWLDWNNNGISVLLLETDRLHCERLAAQFS